MESKDLSAAASAAAGSAATERAEENQELSAVAAAAPSDSVEEYLAKSTADTLCEVALKISSAALLINRAALVMKELVNKDSSGVKVVLPSERSFRLSEERSSQFDAETLHKDTSKDNC